MTTDGWLMRTGWIALAALGLTYLLGFVFPILQAPQVLAFVVAAVAALMFMRRP